MTLREVKAVLYKMNVREPGEVKMVLKTINPRATETNIVLPKNLDNLLVVLTKLAEVNKSTLSDMNLDKIITKTPIGSRKVLVQLNTFLTCEGCLDSEKSASINLEARVVAPAARTASQAVESNRGSDGGSETGNTSDSLKENKTPPPSPV